MMTESGIGDHALFRNPFASSPEAGTAVSDQVKTVVTAKEAALMLGISMPTMYELCHRSDFPAFRIGRKVLVNRPALLDWISRQSGEVL